MGRINEVAASFYRSLRAAEPWHLAVSLGVSALGYSIIATSDSGLARLIAGVAVFIGGTNFAFALLLPQLRAMTDLVDSIDPEEFARKTADAITRYLPPGFSIEPADQTKPPGETRH